LKVSTKNKAVLLNLRNPEQVMAVVPKHKIIPYKGQNLLAVPHALEVVKLLRNMGIDAPSPIRHYYDWSGQYDPFAAQRDTAEFLTLNNRAFVLNDLGTGKTLASLWAYDYLRSIGQATRMLVISPLSTLERVWADEIFRHFPHLTFSVLHGTKKKRVKLLDQNVDVYIINHDGVKVMQDELVKRTDIDLILVDEIAQVARNAGTERWRALKKITKDAARLWGLTGTPIPNDPTDAWAQCRLVVPENVPPYFTRFRDQVMRQCGPYKWLPRDNALDVVHRAMQPSIRFDRDDCIDLPPLMYETREIPLTTVQAKMYKDMLSKLSTEHEGEQIQAVNEAVKLMKLVQIACGTAYSLDREVVVFEPTDRLQELRDIIASSNSKTIVFVPFTATAEMVAAHLEQNGITTGLIYGAISKNKRDEVFKAFQKADDPRVIVAQPAAMSHGLTLTAASTIVWFAPVTSAETYEQANARITRPGQNHSQLIVNLQGTPAESRIYDRLKDKATTQGVLLDLIKGVK
jgi:SNF2 family DNA or RNA helicase